MAKWKWRILAPECADYDEKKSLQMGAFYRLQELIDKHGENVAQIQAEMSGEAPVTCECEPGECCGSKFCRLDSHHGCGEIKHEIIVEEDGEEK